MSDVTHNQKIYADTIRHWIPDISDHDLKFLCNNAANIYQKINDSCIDNFRVSKTSKDNPMSNRYKQAIINGCCGRVDEKYSNPLTGNVFLIGFNYGH